MSWGAENIGSRWLQLHQGLWHSVYSVAREFWSVSMEKGFSFRLLLYVIIISGRILEGHFQLHFSVMWHDVTDLEVVAVPSDTRLAHLDAWQLLLGALSSSSARCWGASTSRWGSGDLPETGGSEPKISMDFHGIYGDFRYDFVSLCRMNTGSIFSSEISSRQGYFHQLLSLYIMYIMYIVVFLFSLGVWQDAVEIERCGAQMDTWSVNIKSFRWNFTRHEAKTTTATAANKQSETWCWPGLMLSMVRILCGLAIDDLIWFVSCESWNVQWEGGGSGRDKKSPTLKCWMENEAAQDAEWRVLTLDLHHFAPKHKARNVNKQKFWHLPRLQKPSKLWKSDVAAGREICKP